jgi:hypothetical protein
MVIHQQEQYSHLQHGWRWPPGKWLELAKWKMAGVTYRLK